MLGATITDEQYITGFRRTLLNKVMAFCAWLILKIMNVNVEHTILTNDDVDYGHYLGPDYRNDKLPDRTPKIISPHSSCFDIQTMCHIFDGNVSFVAGEFILKVPILGSIAKKVGTLFVPRAGKAAAL